MVLPMNYSDRIGWLSVACVLCMCITASTAMHLATWPQIFSACHTSTHVDDCTLQHRSFHALCVLPLVTAPFQRLLHWSGTVCRSRSGRLHRCKFSAADWKPNFLPGLTVMTNNVSLHWLIENLGKSLRSLALKYTLHIFIYVTSLFRLIVTCPCSLRT